jgi:hypothetical protein
MYLELALQRALSAWIDSKAQFNDAPGHLRFGRITNVIHFDVGSRAVDVGGKSP